MNSITSAAQLHSSDSFEENSSYTTEIRTNHDREYKYFAKKEGKRLHIAREEQYGGSIRVYNRFEALFAKIARCTTKILIEDKVFYVNRKSYGNFLKSHRVLSDSTKAYHFKSQFIDWTDQGYMREFLHPTTSTKLFQKLANTLVKKDADEEQLEAQALELVGQGADINGTFYDKNGKFYFQHPKNYIHDFTYATQNIVGNYGENHLSLHAQFKVTEHNPLTYAIHRKFDNLAEFIIRCGKETGEEHITTEELFTRSFKAYSHQDTSQIKQNFWVERDAYGQLVIKNQKVRN